MTDNILNDKNRPGKSRSPGHMVFMMAAAAVCLIVFCVLLWSVYTGSASAFDDPVRKFIYGMRSELLTPIMKIITYTGNWQTVTALCIVLLLIKKTRITYGIPTAAGAVIVTVLNNIIKTIVERPRPDTALHLIEQGGWSFPSGHSITSMCVFAILIYLVRANVQNRRTANLLTALLAIPMVMIGISRMYLGVHYPTDVLAGWCLGLAVALSILAYREHRLLIKQ